jgi:glycosyltransferase involved in cell wall biosynthesis
VKILVVHNYYRQRGGEDVVFELEIEMLRTRGHQVSAYFLRNDDIRLDSARSKLVLLRDSIWSADSHREMTSLLLSLKPDVVHVHNTFPRISPSIYSACADAEVPVVQTLHNYRMFCPAGTVFRDGHACEACLGGGVWRSVMHGCYRGSRTATAAAALVQCTHRRLDVWGRGIARYVALTRFSQEKFIQAGLPPGRIMVKPNFVHPDPGCGDDAGRYALFVGRLSPEKCVDTLLQAWSLIKQDIPLLVVGGGPEFERLRLDAGRRGLDAVHFLGPLAGREAVALMREARFLVFSSGWYENFPMVIAESFACGIPVLCPRLGAMQDIVTHHHTGLHHSPANAAELAEQVIWAWTHPQKTHAMGREARIEYDSKYTAEKNYPILMDIYAEAIREPRAPLK